MKKIMLCAAFVVASFGFANAQVVKCTEKKCEKTEQCTKDKQCKDAKHECDMACKKDCKTSGACCKKADKKGACCKQDAKKCPAKKAQGKKAAKKDKM